MSDSPPLPGNAGPRTAGRSVLAPSSDVDDLSTSLGGTEEIPPLPPQVPSRVAEVAAAVLSRPGRVVEPEILPAIPGYTIVGLLGRGGMGVVYQARHLALRRIVALKLIRTGPEAAAEELARFRTETEAVAALQHPGIVQIYEVGEFQGQPFCALEFVPGGNLAHLADGQPQPAAAAARLVEGLARAIHYAHEHGIVHRDIKPANVLLAADGTPKVTDFGLAKHLEVESGHTRTGQVLGTPSYMAPELILGQVGPAADIYALGAVLYELLTGRPPFQGVTPRDTLRQADSEDPVPPRRLISGVPRDLETITLKCLRKEPTRRYATAVDLAEDLRMFQAGEPIRARPVGIWERGAKWAKRRPATAALLATSALALVSLVGGGMWYNAQLRNAEADLTGALGQVTAERDEANRLRTEADAANDRAMANLLTATTLGDRVMTVVAKHLGDLPDTADARRRLLEEVSRIHDESEQQWEGTPAVEQVRGRSLRQLGHAYSESEGLERAEGAFRGALSIFIRLHKDFPSNIVFQKELASCHHGLATVLNKLAADRVRERRTLKDPRKGAEAEEHATLAVSLQRSLVAQQVDQPDLRVDLARYLTTLGLVLDLLDRYPDAERALGEAAAEAGSRADATGQVYHRAVLAATHAFRGEINEARAGRVKGDANLYLDRAIEYYRNSVAARQAIVDSPAHPRAARSELARSLDRLARVQRSRSRLDEAEANLKSAVGQRRKLVEEFPNTPTYQSDLAGQLSNLASLLLGRGRPKDALPLLQEAIRYQKAVYQLNMKDGNVRLYLRNHYGVLTETHLALRDHAEAAASADLLARVDPRSPSDGYHAARYLARCIDLAASDRRLDAAARESARNAYTDLALQGLTQAGKSGFKNSPGYIPNQKGRPLDHKDLNPIRDVPGFKKLLSDLTPGNAKAGT